MNQFNNNDFLIGSVWFRLCSITKKYLFVIEHIQWQINLFAFRKHFFVSYYCWIKIFQLFLMSVTLFTNSLFIHCHYLFAFIADDVKFLFYSFYFQNDNFNNTYTINDTKNSNHIIMINVMLNASNKKNHYTI